MYCLFVGALAQTSCTGQPDGTILEGSGCHLATVCWSEVPTITECRIEDGMVLDTTTGLCDTLVGEWWSGVVGEWGSGGVGEGGGGELGSGRMGEWGNGGGGVEERGSGGV